MFTVVFHTVEEDPDFRPKDRRTKEDMIEAAKKTALQAFSNPFHDLYNEQIKSQLRDSYSKFKDELHEKLSREFFSTRHVGLAVVAFGAAFGLTASIVSRTNFEKLWLWIRTLLNMQ